jgi:SecD/SecF fusion protein
MEGFLWGRQFFVGQNPDPSSGKKPIIEFLGRDQGDEQIADGFCSKGDYREWISLVNDILIYPDVAFLLYASLATPLLPVLGVGGVLGGNDLHDTIVAGLVALAAIFSFLVLAYRGKGLIAAFTTSVSLWLLLSAFVLLHAPLSLSAIVAFVLAIGIASDANIIAFERSHEEARGGAVVHQALAHGAKKSFRTILDANATVFLCAIILLAVGIGPIRGFALTTMLSIVLSFLANVLLAHWLLHLAYGHDQGRRLFWRRHDTSNVAAMPHAGRDYVRYGILAISGCVLFLLAGGYSLATKPLNLDIEFKAGTALDIQLPQAITQDVATQRITDSGIAPATVAIGGTGHNMIAARFDDVLDTGQVNAVVGQFRKTYGPAVTFAENTADPGVARSLARRSIMVVLLSLLGTALFILWRFNWRMSLASVVSVVSSVLFVMSCFALLHLEIDITFIAAMLIVIGYALNEAVVVFDRIRERLHDAGRPSVELVNVSIQQVLKRSLYTVLTVVIGAVSLFTFGAEPLQMFSLAIFLGLVWGTFASLFIAPRLWLAFAKPGVQVDIIDRA